MANLTPLNFTPETTEDMGDGFKVIPPGTYAVVIVGSDIKDTKAGTGKILELTYQIIEGPQTGNPLVDRLKVQNPSETSQKIGLSQLKNICEAIGHTGQLKDSEQLHGKPFSVQVEIEKFKSNTTGKDLESSKVVKRMKRTESVMAQYAPPVSSGSADQPQQKKAAW